MIDRIATALSRRHLLMGLAASATAAASVAEAASAPQENPQLLALADELPALTAKHLEARDRVRAIVAVWSPQWPVPSAELVRYGSDCKDYRGIDGWGLRLPEGKGMPIGMPKLGTPEYFEQQAAYHEREAARRAATKSKRNVEFHQSWAARERAQIEPSRAYWAEVERITEASGINEAQAQLAKARDALKAKVDQIMRADDWTIAGTVIKAQALQAWSGVDTLHRGFNVEGLDWADLVAASIMRHAQAA
jgi:hypothetical protein